MFGPFVVRISRIVLGSEHFWVPVGGGAGGSPRDRILQGIEREGRGESGSYSTVVFCSNVPPVFPASF